MTTATTAVNHISNLSSLNSTSPPPSSGATLNSKHRAQSPSNLFGNQSQQLSNLCKGGSLLNSNASASEAGSPNLVQQTSAGNLQAAASIAGPNSSNIPLSLSSNTNMNAHQTALLNELFANGNIIDLSANLNIIQQLSQPVYIAISTNPIILLPINSALANQSSSVNSQNSTGSTNTITTASPSTTNKLSSSTASQDAGQLLNNHLSGLLNQAFLESLNKGNNSFIHNLLNNPQSNQTNSNSLQLNSSSVNSSPPLNNTANAPPRTGDEPMDLSSKRRCTASRLNSVVSLLEQQENFATNPQLLKSIDALNALNANQNATDAQIQAAAAAFFLPKSTSSLSPLTAQQQLQLILNQPRIYSCSNCQIDFHKQENYAIHKKYYCSATKQLLEQQAQKQSPTPDDLETANHLLNSGPNSPQSNQSQQQQQLLTNRTLAASSNSTSTQSLVDTFNQITKKTSTSSSVAINNHTNSKNSECVSPSISNSPVGSPPSFINSNQLTASASLPPAQPVYKHFCNKCGIRFTSKDNLHAHQTYYCMSNANSLNGSGLSTITTFNSASGQTEVNCPKCK